MATLVPPSAADNVQVVTIQNPETGELTQQVVHTVIDENTGEVKQQCLDLPKGTTNYLEHYTAYYALLTNYYRGIANHSSSFFFFFQHSTSFYQG